MYCCEDSTGAFNCELTDSPSRMSLWISWLPALWKSWRTKVIVVDSVLLIPFQIENNIGHLTHFSRTIGKVVGQFFLLLINFFLEKIDRSTTDQSCASVTHWGELILTEGDHDHQMFETAAANGQLSPTTNMRFRREPRGWSGSNVLLKVLFTRNKVWLDKMSWPYFNDQFHWTGHIFAILRTSDSIDPSTVLA